MKIGVYVGSFNPVHLGHIKIVEYLVKNFLHKVIVVPTGNYWDKTELINIEHRINMLKFFENDKVLINNTLNNKKYTYEILDALKEENKFDELYLIIGADNLPKFHLWKNVSDILKNKVIVLNRDGLDVFKYINRFKEKDNFVVISDLKPIDISSTMIRNNVDDMKDCLDNRVYKYIKDNKLYKGEL